MTDDGQGIYTYNEKGELASVEDAVNETITRYEDDKTSVYSTDNSNLLYEYKTTEDGFRFERHPQADGEVSQWIAEHYQDTDYENGVSQKTIAFNGSNIATIKETTDKLGRLSQTNIIKPNNSSVLKKNFQYKDLSVNRTTEQVSRIDYTFGNGSTFNENYTYNNYGQIETITDSAGNVKRYKYDGFGQLIREDDPVKNKTILYSYSEGNLTKKQEYAYTTADTVGTCTNEISYTYGDNNRKDLLTSYNGQTITYDAIGNPTNYKGITLTWEKGRQLKTYDRGSLIIDYKYDVNGLRTQKKIGNTEHKYTYVNGQLYAYEVNGQQMFFTYDDNGSPLSFTYNGTVYHYQTNLQGDVIGIINNSGTKVVSYSYDAWGCPTGSVPSSGVGYYNPLRYRGYVFDYETGWYYLQSRYYDPNMGRFLNADDPLFLGASGTVLGHNLFIYCENNMINHIDSTGYKAIDITIRLTSTMSKNALYLYSLARLYRWAGLVGKLALLYKFYTLVKTNGKWDLKNQRAWKLKSGDYYTFMGIKLTVADIGNIHFGFVGSVLFSWKTLCAGAGLYQIYSGTSSWKFWYSFFDDPRDALCISIGRTMWKIAFRKWVFQW